jgi:ubiquinone/menaquinone biosynthesis C-methylase UbiE
MICDWKRAISEEGSLRMNDAPKETPPGAGGSSLELIDSKAFFRELKLKEGSAFLDIACGRGMYTLAVSKIIGEKGTVYAVDLWEEAIVMLKEEAAARGIANIKASVADVGIRIPLGDRTIDVALMATVLHDLVESGKAAAAIKETARVLKRGGEFAVVEFKKIDGPPGPPVSIRLREDEVESLVSPFGFKKKRLLDLGPYNYLMIFRLQPPP